MVNSECDRQFVIDEEGCTPVEAARVCCERCPGATMASTRHIHRRRLLKAALFQPEHAGQSGEHGAADGAGSGAADGAGAAGRAQPANGAQPADGARQAGGRRSAVGQWTPTAYPAGAPAPATLHRAATGQVIDVSPQVIVIGHDGGERRFALTADATAWRGVPLDPSALSTGDEAVVRLLPSRPGVADRVWANIGRVTGTIMVRDGDYLLVAEGKTKKLQTVIIPPVARVRLQVRFPTLQPDPRDRRDDHGLELLRFALGDEQVIPVADHDRAGDAADVGPDPVGNSRSRRQQPDDGLISGAQRRGI